MPSNLDVKKIVEPILENYNETVLNFIHLLKTLNCSLVYPQEGNDDDDDILRQHIINRTTYACSVELPHSKRTDQYLKYIFPIMIGSDLDIAIRKERKNRDFFISPLKDHDFVTGDIAITNYIICGIAQHLPYFYTNDATNMHVIRNQIVRCYVYDSNHKGKEISYNGHTNELTVKLNNNDEEENISYFFEFVHIYPEHQKEYMFRIIQRNDFDIDHLGNKIVMSSGNVFLKLFKLHCYNALKSAQYNLAKKNCNIITKSINTGCLLQTLSRKTQYDEETMFTGKMINNVSKKEHREIGQNGIIFAEKKTGCYRPVKFQIYPLIPQLSHLIIRQISNKVKNVNVEPKHSSHHGRFCILGSMDTKSIGRSNVLTRGTYVSTTELLNPMYYTRSEMNYYFFRHLNLEILESTRYFVVVNDACIGVSQHSFRTLLDNLLKIKKQFLYIECYSDDKNFIFIRYKVGILFKRFEDDVWVSSRDEMYWAKKLYNISDLKHLIEHFGYPYITSYLTDINPYFNHNSFPKNILAYNCLKNAVLATTIEYSEYFLETISVFNEITPYHQCIQEPVDAFSSRFALFLPKLNVCYYSFLGNNQEDCIIVKDALTAFDAIRFYSIHVKFQCTVPGTIVFHPIRGDEIANNTYVGTVVYHGTGVMTVLPFSAQLKIIQKFKNQSEIHFAKSPFQIRNFNLSSDKLSICLTQTHVSEMADKLCSLHGQKGVIYKSDSMPVFENNLIPDLIVNPYCIFRMTIGQFVEGREAGGRDMLMIRNSDGRPMTNTKVFCAPTFYFAVAYYSSEHIYAPTDCSMDQITGQTLKGRSRGGGMRIGNMELMNGLRGNGLASCFEEKFFQHGDQIVNENLIALPKAVNLVTEDMKFFKFNVHMNTEDVIEEID